MKKLMTMVLMAVLATGTYAQEKKDSVKSNKPVFTTIKENKITSIKDQNRSGTRKAARHTTCRRCSWQARTIWTAQY